MELKKKKIALLANDAICYGSLIYYLEHIAAVLRMYGYQTEFVSVIDDAFLTAGWDAVIGINQVTLSVKLENGVFLLDLLGCPIFAIIVDPPYYHDLLLREHPKNMHLICIDEGHVRYCRQYYEPFQSVEMGFVLGSVQQGIPYSKRKIGVLFTGTNTDRFMMAGKIAEYQTPWISDLFWYLVEAGKAAPNERTEKHVLSYFRDKNMNVSKGDIRLAMSICGNYAEFWLRGYYREMIIGKLLGAGIPLTVAGNGWEELQERYPAVLHWRGSLEFNETASLMADARIVLNVMPWFKDGCHERIPTSMHNGAACVTDGSSYINSHFQDGEDIVLYDLENLEELPGKIAYLLEHEETAEEIAEKGHEKAGRDYTWENMVENNILKYL